MATKTPPLSIYLRRDPSEDDATGHRTPPDRRAAHLLLRRIAEALQVPPETLHRPSKAAVPAPNAGDVGEPSLDGECEALLHAYRRIHDPEMRQRLLILVREVAERA